MNELTAFTFNSTSGELLSYHRSDKRLQVNELTGNNLVETDASAQSWLEYTGTGAAISWIVLYCKHSGEVCQSITKETFPWFLRARDERTLFWWRLSSLDLGEMWW